jgi:phosphoribosylglycinamide formyltransferase-1
MISPIKIALMASGTGTNVIKLIEHAQNKKNIKIIGIIVDQPTSKLLNEKISVPVILIEKNVGDKKSIHEEKILIQLKEWNIDWILLAGFMRLLSKKFLNLYKNKVVNIHPSLLPLYPGAHAYEKAFADNVIESGVTIHFVDEGMDTGKIWQQEAFKRFSQDTFEDFVKRGKEIEWSLYPKFLDWLEQIYMESE